MRIETQISKMGTGVSARILALIDKHCDGGTLKDAMRYSINAGGKRLRPVLCLLGARLFGDENNALDIACAIEMIHTYSLIHDDLPAMDDDDLRRGKPTSHVMFGEAMAILAGDALLNLAFEVMLENAAHNSSRQALQAAAMVARAAGPAGMIAGQADDIKYAGKQKDERILLRIHERKTAAMIEASAASGAVMNGAKKSDVEALMAYGARIGLAFQIIDDILDETGSRDRLGKTPGKDSAAGKQSFAILYGIEQARRMAQRSTDEAVRALERFGSGAKSLADLARFLQERDR